MWGDILLAGHLKLYLLTAELQSMIWAYCRAHDLTPCTRVDTSSKKAQLLLVVLESRAETL